MLDLSNHLVDGGYANMQISRIQRFIQVNPGFRNVQYELSDYEQPIFSVTLGLIGEV